MKDDKFYLIEESELSRLLIRDMELKALEDYYENYSECIDLIDKNAEGLRILFKLEDKPGRYFHDIYRSIVKDTIEKRFIDATDYFQKNKMIKFLQFEIKCLKKGKE